MIFVTLGSQKFPFDRLLRAVDALPRTEEIFAQTGYSTYHPVNYPFVPFMNREEFADTLEKADIVITHGGTGVIINAVKKGKKVIAVPRLAKYGEHIDDHQIQLISQFRDLNLIYACEDMDLTKALETVKKTQYRTYKSNTGAFIASLEEYIDSLS